MFSIGSDVTIDTPQLLFCWARIEREARRTYRDSVRPGQWSVKNCGPLAMVAEICRLVSSDDRLKHTAQHAQRWTSRLRDLSDPADDIGDVVKDTTGLNSVLPVASSLGRIDRVGLADGRTLHGLTLHWKMHGFLLTAEVRETKRTQK